jgi:hypothetical protein
VTSFVSDPTNSARKRNKKKRNISMEDLAAHSPQKIIIETVLFMV